MKSGHIFSDELFTARRHTDNCTTTGAGTVTSRPVHKVRYVFPLVSVRSKKTLSLLLLYLPLWLGKFAGKYRDLLF